MRTPRSKRLVVELLRTLDDALSDTNGTGASSDGGVIQMPVLYHHGSYSELERCLGKMRDRYRQHWWHTSMRYRWGDPHKRMVVPSRKTRQGRIPLLPERTELRIQGETLDKGLMVVWCYEWAEEVDMRDGRQGTRHPHQPDVRRRVVETHPAQALPRQTGASMNVTPSFTTITLGYAECKITYVSRNFWSRYVAV